VTPLRRLGRPSRLLKNSLLFRFEEGVVAVVERKFDFEGCILGEFC
jgi:hypothetical protein